MADVTHGTENRAIRVCRLLNRHRVRYLIAGGVAANLHGSVRATLDVDILVPGAGNELAYITIPKPTRTAQVGTAQAGTNRR